MQDLRQDLDPRLNQISEFIHEALNRTPSHLEIEAEPDQKTALILEKSLDALEFESIPDVGFNGNVAAIDGGSAGVLFGRSFLVGAYRAGYTAFRDFLRVEEIVSPLELEIITKPDREKIFSEAFQKLTGQLPSETPELEKILDRLRFYSEWKLADQLLDRLSAGDFLLIDGSLQATLALPDSFLQRMTEKAVEKKITLVGVSKSTTLYWGDKSPLIPAVVKKAQSLGIDYPWFCKIGDLRSELQKSHWFGTVYIARFKSAADFAFRVDINHLEQSSSGQVFGVLRYLSSDPLFLGYPYPLAATHQLARITHTEIDDVRYRLQQKAWERGITESDWDLLFRDFHSILNADLSH